MKQFILHIFEPLLINILAYVTDAVKPLFLQEDSRLQHALKNLGYHDAVCAHPSIVFGYREKCEEKSLVLLSWKIAFLRKCIKLGLLRTEQGHAMMKRLGMQDYFGYGVSFWFEESNAPIVAYHVPQVENKTSKGKIVIYSVLTGSYDQVREPLYKEPGVDYILFTNNPRVKSAIWKVILVDSTLDNVLLSREIKMLPHKYLPDQYDLSIYVDANIVIYGELSLLANYLTDKISFAVSKHGERSTVADEVEAIGRQLKHIDIDAARLQYQHYLEEGFVDNVGLAECGILVRKHKDKKLQELMNMWWTEFQSGIRRDQISLMPCIQKCHFEDYVLMDGYVRHNQYCRVVSHNEK